MKFPTVIKKYRIIDYSQLSDLDLQNKFEKLNKKHSLLNKEKLTHAFAEKMFGITINLHNIVQEFYNRYPWLKNAIDFDGEISDILEKNQINASKN